MGVVGGKAQDDGLHLLCAKRRPHQVPRYDDGFQFGRQMIVIGLERFAGVVSSSGGGGAADHGESCAGWGR